MSESQDLVKIPIAEIRIGDRFRKEMGDLEQLADSIAKQGLLQPIGITSDHELVFGERRLRACRDVLGLTDVEVRVVDVTSIVEGEHDENEVRKDFNFSERMAIAEAVERELGERRGRRSEKWENSPTLEGRTRDIAAKAAGFSSGRTYEEAKAVILDAVPELVDMLDEEEISISAAASIAKQPKEDQAIIIEMPVKERREAVSNIRKGQPYSLNDPELARKMQQHIVDKVQGVAIGFAMADEAEMSGEEFVRDALPYTKEVLAERAPRLIRILNAVLREASYDQAAAR